jgi:pimeloyl-ACP methyl ester carboxylesterase
MQADLVPDTIQTAGGTVRCGIWGDGPPMVLLHGTPFSSSVWREVLPGLVSAHRVFVRDMLGFGQSEQRHDQDVSLARQGRVFAQLLRHWELRSPSVVAHDVGGVVALRALLLEGSSYHELTLVDAVGVPGWSGGGFFEVTSQNPDVFSRLPGFAHRALVANKIADASHRGLRPAALEEFLHPWCGDGGQAASTASTPRPAKPTPPKSRIGSTVSPCRSASFGAARTGGCPRPTQRKCAHEYPMQNSPGSTMQATWCKRTPPPSSWRICSGPFGAQPRDPRPARITRRRPARRPRQQPDPDGHPVETSQPWAPAAPAQFSRPASVTCAVQAGGPRRPP